MMQRSLISQHLGVCSCAEEQGIMSLTPGTSFPLRSRGLDVDACIHIRRPCSESGTSTLCYSHSSHLPLMVHSLLTSYPSSFRQSRPQFACHCHSYDTLFPFLPTLDSSLQGVQRFLRLLHDELDRHSRTGELLQWAHLI